MTIKRYQRNDAGKSYGWTWKSIGTLWESQSEFLITRFPQTDNHRWNQNGDQWFRTPFRFQTQWELLISLGVVKETRIVCTFVPIYRHKNKTVIEIVHNVPGVAIAKDQISAAENTPLAEEYIDIHLDTVHRAPWTQESSITSESDSRKNKGASKRQITQQNTVLGPKDHSILHTPFSA